MFAHTTVKRIKKVFKVVITMLSGNGARGSKSAGSSSSGDVVKSESFKSGSKLPTPMTPTKLTGRSQHAVTVNSASPKKSKNVSHIIILTIKINNETAAINVLGQNYGAGRFLRNSANFFGIAGA